MVRNIWILSACAEVPNEETVRKMRAFNFPVCPSLAVLGLNQVAIGPGCIGIGYNDVAFDNAAIFELHASNRARLDKDFLNLCVSLDQSALSLDE